MRHGTVQFFHREKIPMTHGLAFKSILNWLEMERCHSCGIFIPDKKSAYQTFRTGRKWTEYPILFIRHGIEAHKSEKDPRKLIMRTNAVLFMDKGDKIRPLGIVFSDGKVEVLRKIGFDREAHITHAVLAKLNVISVDHKNKKVKV